MNRKFNLILLCIALACGFWSCKDKYTSSYLANVPVYLDFETFRNQTFEVQPSKSVMNAGKIWIRDQYLFVNEPLQGIHIFDNSDPSNPINLGFLPIHANVDMAVKQDLLYADSYTDLLTFDISDPTDPKLVCRSEEVFNFQAIHMIGDFNQDYRAAGVDFNQGVVVGWNLEEVTEEMYDNSNWFLQEEQFLVNDVAFSSEASGNTGTSAVSVGGSMARFTINQNHLHILQQWSLTSFNLDNVCPEQTAINNILREGETIFSTNENLFIGTTSGMLIYGVESDPGNPEFISDYPHVMACDPVVVRNNRAYVTLRTGNWCQGNINELVVVDVSNLEFPQEIATYQMTNPHGLGIDGNTLFLCDGSDGLKVFDASNDLTIDDNLISHFQNIQTFDVIPYNDRLIMSASEGIYQYDYSDLSNITQMSLIPTN